jgi:O-antigen/teichoic acid export membrane protein
LSGAVRGPRDDLQGASGRPESASPLFGRGMLYTLIWSLQLVAATIVSPMLTHVLSPAAFGALATAIALHQVISVLALLGIDSAVVLERSEDSDGHAARGLVAVGIAISFVVTLVFVVSLPLWEDSLGFGSFHSLLLAVVLWTGPTAALQVVQALLLTEDRFRPFALVGTIAAVGGQVVGLILLFTVRADVAIYAWGGVGAQFVAMIVGIIVIRPSVRGLVNWPVARRAISLGIPLAFAGLSWIVLSAADRLIIQVIQGPEQVARYQVGYIVGSVVITLLLFTHGAWAPQFAALRTNAERSALATRSRDQLYRLLLPTLLGITLAAPSVLRVVAPASFTPGPLTLVVFLVAFSAFPVAAELASAQILIVERRGKTIGILTAVAALINIALNFALVPLIGIVGAAIATTVAFAALALFQRRVLPHEMPWKRPPTRLIVAIGLCAAAGGASILIPQTLVWNLIRLALAVACLPWFFWSFNRARRTSDTEPTRSSRGGHAAPHRNAAADEGTPQ